MPKFTYTAAKGIEQSSGSGFFVNGAAVIENQQSITAADTEVGGTDFDNPYAYGATTVTTTGSGSATATLADAEYVGAMKYFSVAAGDGDLVITPDNFTDATTFTLATTGQFLLLTWDGSGWSIVKNVGTVATA